MTSTYRFGAPRHIAIRITGWVFTLAMVAIFIANPFDGRADVAYVYALVYMAWRIAAEINDRRFWDNAMRLQYARNNAAINARIAADKAARADA